LKAIKNMSRLFFTKITLIGRKFLCALSFFSNKKQTMILERIECDMRDDYASGDGKGIKKMQ